MISKVHSVRPTNPSRWQARRQAAHTPNDEYHNHPRRKIRLTKSQALRRTYTTALTHWPKDTLRPTCQLQDVLSKRLAESNKFAGPDANTNPAAQVNALVSLLGNRYLHKYPTSPAPESATGGMLKPRSNPTYYDDLMRDLDAAPTRSWVQRAGLKLKGMFRWQ